MKIIVPMAGRGSRLRPHTLTIPKPLIPIAGKPIVQRLVEDIVKVCAEDVEEIAFIIGDFGKETEENLKAIAEGLGAKGSIYYQDEPLGTAHAIMCAKPSLSGNMVVAFADTLFRADFTLNSDSDGVIWTKKVEDPSAFGVIKKNEEGVITDFVEKPQEFVSDEAIIGIYYFKDGDFLRDELQYLLDNNIRDKGEFQLTNALENMKNKGSRFTSGTVNEWMDCGNKDVTVETNGKILEFVEQDEKLVSDKATIENSEIIAPCYIAEGVVIKDSKIGPKVSIGKNTRVENSTIDNTIIQNDSEVVNAQLTNSMIGNKAVFNGKFSSVSIGDYSRME
ncbi:MAG TPA: nucleotidyltransferase [Cryomorphaceae bacterium]|nr:nucleotidyltransferase [Owenweeksia sp.]MBF99169.1 nucleotidyltransferase [Owenweeksia sp.]HAD96242.1 nucleotidyltransferase [Cryomorphaceae bacterium]HBF19312.1 nucleotidyltransferase [Cryomorphaceae bacterium]|tara:strand:+ start:412 stop:1416 length:1005 start_codon:yes stop_codon:yes gene_type:complete